jgi:hypothetical protein
MKPTKAVLVALALTLVPAAASAQGYSGPSNGLPGGFHNRQGRLIFGGSLGLGAMKDSGGDIQCANCDYSPIAGELSGHVGGFLTPRMALLGELQFNAQTLSVDGYGDTETLIQSVLMLSAQYWITPQLWVKGGVGFANLRVDHSYYGTVQEVPENGFALLGAVGFELLSSRDFSVDIQGRLINGSYDSINNNVTGLSVGVGLNWF